MSKMIRKTLSLVLALSLVYLMSASAFAANDSYGHYMEFDEGVNYVDFGANICDAYVTGSAALTSLETGEVSVDAFYTYQTSSGTVSDQMHSYDLSYASVYADAPAHAFMTVAYFDFYAGVPSFDGWVDYSIPNVGISNLHRSFRYVME